MPYSYTPLFGKKWYKRSTKDHAKASQKFWKAAFYARQSSDEHVKQVGYLAWHLLLQILNLQPFCRPCLH